MCIRDSPDGGCSAYDGAPSPSADGLETDASYVPYVPGDEVVQEHSGVAGKRMERPSAEAEVVMLRAQVAELQAALARERGQTPPPEVSMN